MFYANEFLQAEKISAKREIKIENRRNYFATFVEFMFLT